MRTSISSGHAEMLWLVHIAGLRRVPHSIDTLAAFRLILAFFSSGQFLICL
jgi:hypothetical protein